MAVRALLGFAALLAVLHVLDPRDPRFALVSEFAFEQPVLTGAAFLLLAAGIAGVAVLVARVRRLAWPGAALLLIAAAGFAVLAFAPTDHRGTVEATTPVGEVHDAVASTGALVLTLGGLLAWAAVRWQGAVLYVVAVNAAFWIPAVLAPDWPGLFQRAWLGAVLLSLLPLAARARARAGASRGS